MKPLTPTEYNSLPEAEKGLYEKIWQYQKLYCEKWYDESRFAGHDYSVRLGLNTRKIFRLKEPIKLDLDKLDKEVDDFIANTTAEDYNRMLDKEPVPETVEQAAEKRFPFITDDTEIGKYIISSQRFGFIIGANWKNPDNISRARVIEILEADAEYEYISIKKALRKIKAL